MEFLYNLVVQKKIDNKGGRKERNKSSSIIYCYFICNLLSIKFMTTLIRMQFKPCLGEKKQFTPSHPHAPK
jgi:hypothetical protein